MTVQELCLALARYAPTAEITLWAHDKEDGLLGGDEAGMLSLMSVGWINETEVDKETADEAVLHIQCNLS